VAGSRFGAYERSDLALALLPGRFAICQLPPGVAPPEAPPGSPLWSVTQTAAETSLVLPEDFVEARWRAERGYRCLVVQGPLPFSAVGVLAQLSSALAEGNIPLFALSTFDTDYLLVRDEHLASALRALQDAGCRVG
jgi:hypothetical protein